MHKPYKAHRPRVATLWARQPLGLHEYAVINVGVESAEEDPQEERTYQRCTPYNDDDGCDNESGGVIPFEKQ